MPPDIAAHVAQESTKLVFDLPPQYIALGFVLLGLSVLVSLGAGISTIWNNFKPRPSAADSLHAFAKEVAKTYATKESVDSIKDFTDEAPNTFATKDELTHLEQRITDQCSEARKDRAAELSVLRAEMTSLRSMMTQGFAELQRSIGRVEGKVAK
jgi:hypothetical protein